MFLRIFLPLLLLPLLLQAQKTPKGKAPVPESFRVNTAPAIDGDLTDWGYAFENNQKNELQCFVGNDGAYIYLGIRVQDPGLQARIMQRGLSIWIDTLGKQKHHRGVGYPLPVQENQWNEWTTQARGERIGMENLYIERHCQDFDLLGFADEALRVSNLTSRDMKVAARFDMVRNLYFELKIPIRQIFQDEIPGKLLSFHVKVNEPKTNLEEENGGGFNNNDQVNAITQNNPMMGGMGGGMGMGGMNNPNLAANRSQRSPMVNSAPGIWWRVLLVAAE